MTNNLLYCLETIVNLVQIALLNKTFIYELVQLGAEEELVAVNFLVLLGDNRVIETHYLINPF